MIRKWKDAKLAALRTAQLLDIALSTANRRCIFVAEAVGPDGAAEIVGCCEVVEEQVDLLAGPAPDVARSERARRKTARHRPLIENLCVGRAHRRAGVGRALVRACERAVRRWPGHDEIFAQVREDGTPARELFLTGGYRCLFADPTCRDVILEEALFAKEIVVTKWMLRKFLAA